VHVSYRGGGTFVTGIVLREGSDGIMWGAEVKLFGRKKRRRDCV